MSKKKLANSLITTIDTSILDANAITTTNVTSNFIESNTITGLTTTLTGTLGKTLTTSFGRTCGVANITNAFINANWGQGHSGSNTVTFMGHPLPGKTITWVGYIFGKDSDGAFTNGEVRVYKTPSGGSEALQTTQAFTGAADADTVYQAFSSSFTTVTGDTLRVQARRTNGSNGSECIIYLLGEFTI